MLHSFPPVTEAAWPNPAPHPRSGKHLNASKCSLYRCFSSTQTHTHGFMCKYNHINFCNDCSKDKYTGRCVYQHASYTWTHMYGLERQANTLKDSKKSKARKDHWNNPRGFLPCIKQSLLPKASSVRLHNMLKSYSMMGKPTRTNNEIFSFL